LTTLIRNGTVVTSEKSFPADILIDGEKIREIAATIPIDTADRVIDASGMLLLPGGIDVHTHLDMPFGGTTSSDDFETGTRAAAFGGTTTLIDFAIQARGMKMRDALDTWWKKAENRASIDYGLHMIVTDLYEAGLEDMDAMVGNREQRPTQNDRVSFQEVSNSWGREVARHDRTRIPRSSGAPRERDPRF